MAPRPLGIREQDMFLGLAWSLDEARNAGKAFSESWPRMGSGQHIRGREGRGGVTGRRIRGCLPHELGIVRTGVSCSRFSPAKDSEDEYPELWACSKQVV